MRQPTVLIVTLSEDMHADAVAAVLKRDHNATVHRVDMRTIWSASTGTVRIDWGAYTSSIGTSTEAIDLGQIGAVWWRRPSACQLPDVYSGVSRSFVQAEYDHFIEGLLWSTSAFWVNDPVFSRRAARRVVQLRTAHEVGFAIPRAVISNDREEIRKFAQDVGDRLVVKRVGTGPGPASMTTLVDPTSVDTIIDGLLPTPAIFQQYIGPGIDLRTIWIGGKHWTARIRSGEGTSPQDCRYDHLVPYEVASLSNDVESSLRHLMFSLGLCYGAIDFRVDEQGSVYFLEVNPGGQFLYLQARLGVPLVENLAALLAREAVSSSRHLNSSGDPVRYP